MLSKQNSERKETGSVDEAFRNSAAGSDRVFFLFSFRGRVRLRIRRAVHRARRVNEAHLRVDGQRRRRSCRAALVARIAVPVKDRAPRTEYQIFSRF